MTSSRLLGPRPQPPSPGALSIFSLTHLSVFFSLTSFSILLFHSSPHLSHIPFTPTLGPGRQRSPLPWPEVTQQQSSGATLCQACPSEPGPHIAAAAGPRCPCSNETPPGGDAPRLGRPRPASPPPGPPRRVALHHLTLTPPSTHHPGPTKPVSRFTSERERERERETEKIGRASCRERVSSPV